MQYDRFGFPVPPEFDAPARQDLLPGERPQPVGPRRAGGGKRLVVVALLLGVVVPAVLLPAVTRFSLRGAPGRYATVARAMGLATAADGDDAAGSKLVAGLASLNARLEVPPLSGCRGVDRGRFDAAKEKMASDALASGSPQNNPVVPTAAEIVALYEEAW